MQQVKPAVNHYTFSGDGINLVYHTHRPGPIRYGEDYSGGQINYRGSEGDQSFYGKDIMQQSCPLGTMLTITLKVNDDHSKVMLTLFIPEILVNTGSTLNFETLALQANCRGPITEEGVATTYTVVPLQATANHAILPH